MAVLYWNLSLVVALLVDLHFSRLVFSTLSIYSESIVQQNGSDYQFQDYYITCTEQSPPWQSIRISCDIRALYL